VPAGWPGCHWSVGSEPVRIGKWEVIGRKNAEASAEGTADRAENPSAVSSPPAIGDQGEVRSWFPQRFPRVAGGEVGWHRARRLTPTLTPKRGRSVVRPKPRIGRENLPIARTKHVICAHLCTFVRTLKMTEVLCYQQTALKKRLCTPHVKTCQAARVSATRFAA
jgi:hypothetical protein